MLICMGVKSQVYCMRYTHYAQLDTTSKVMMKDTPYNTTICVDYYKGKISIEDNDSVFLLDIIYESGNQDNAFYECRSSDFLEWKISILATNNQYLCVISRDLFTRIYKKQR